MASVSDFHIYQIPWRILRGACNDILLYSKRKAIFSSHFHCKWKSCWFYEFLFTISVTRASSR